MSNSVANSVSNSVLLAGPRPPRDRRRNPLWRLRRLLFLLGLFGVGSVLGALYLLSRIELDLADDDIAELAQTGYICTAEVSEACGPEVAVAQLTAGEDRVSVTYQQVPAVVINAVVATEDKDYFTHPGLDPYGIARALYQDIREQRASQGGSTITQQYVKNTFTGDDGTLLRKLREATLAVKLERELTKEEILTRYLNRVYFGRGAYGVQAAAQNYFGKDVEALDLADAAFLAGLLRSPSRADPANDPEEATRRRAVTLTRMIEDGYISQADADEANGRDWSTVVPPINREGLGDVLGAAFGTEYFVEAVRQQLALLYPQGALYTSGLRVYTTLDPELQRAAYNTVTDVTDPRTNSEDPSGSIVAVDDRGRVVAMMGGYDFDRSQVNLALGRSGGGSGRQPGSAFKPFALAEALEQGFAAKSFFAAPPSITLPGANDGADWVVSGGGSSEGYRDLVDGLRVSSNVVYAQLMVELGPQSVVELAQRLGVSAELPWVNAVVLGSGEVSVLDMAAAYSTIASQGVRYSPILIERVEDASGRVCWYPVDGVCSAGPGREPSDPAALDRGIAGQVTAAMVDVVQSGTGRSAQFEWPAAGKTGTTQDNRDAWFVGFTCGMTASVWMGHPGGDGAPSRTLGNFRGIEVSGGDFPAEMWSAFMSSVASSGWAEGRPPCTDLATEPYGDGIVLNPELSTTTLPPCPPPTVETTQPGEPGEDTTGATVPDTAAPDTTAPDTTAPDTTLPNTTLAEPCQPLVDEAAGGDAGDDAAGPDGTGPDGAGPEPTVVTTLPGTPRGTAPGSTDSGGADN